MITDKNSVGFNFRSLSENDDIVANISVDGDFVDDIKLAKLLTSFLRAIESKISINVNG